MQIVARRLEPGEIDYELVWLGASLASLGVAVAWFTLGLPWPHCVFHDLTGLPCVTCGMTRCGIQFFHGSFQTAWKWNPLVFVVCDAGTALANKAFQAIRENIDTRLGCRSARAKLDLSADTLAQFLNCRAFLRNAERLTQTPYNASNHNFLRALLVLRD
jgi:Protein of unknown function (DUF2752)